MNRSPRRALAAILALSVLVALPSSRVAASPERPVSGAVVIVQMADCCPDESWPAAEDALKAELELVDISVVLVPGRELGESERRIELGRMASQHGAAAAVRLVQSEGGARRGVELWIDDRITAKTTYREIVIEHESEAQAAIVVAVRTVEALRASLVELRLGDQTRQGTTYVPEPIAELVEDLPLATGVAAGFFGVRAAGSLCLAPGGIGPRGCFSLAGVIQPLPGLDLEIQALLSPIGGDVESRWAESDFDFALFRGAVFYRFLAGRMVQPAVGAGGGALIGWVEGRSLDGTPLLTDHATVAYLGGGARLHVFPTDRFGVMLGGMVGATVPEIRATHGGNRAASFGRPLGEVRLGVELRFP